MTASWAWTDQKNGDISWKFVNADKTSSHAVVLYRNNYIFGGAFWPIYLGPDDSVSQMLDGTKAIPTLSGTGGQPMGIVDYGPSASPRYLVHFIFTLAPGQTWSTPEGGFTGGITPTAGVCYDLVSHSAGVYSVAYDPQRVTDYDNQTNTKDRGYSPNPTVFTTYAFQPEQTTPENSLGYSDTIKGGWAALGSCMAACEATTTDLFVFDRPGDLQLGMMAGTSPSITTLPGGGWQAAFQANTGNLWVVGTDNRGDTKLGMMAGNSTSITALPGGGWQVAFQANTGNLWVVGTKDNRGDMKLGMMKGTSPCITALPGGGWQVAFQANTSNLWVVGTKDNRGDMKLGMMVGTNPSITALPNDGWQAAFQANTVNLWVVGTKDNRGDLKLGMKEGTSPSIAALSDNGWQAAFQANTGNLWVVGTNDNRGDLKLGMQNQSSPSIAALSDNGWQAAFQANTGNLWVVGTHDNPGDMKVAMNAASSPSITHK